MRKWSNWHNGDVLDPNYGYWKAQHGIYQIRIVDTKGEPIAIPRIGGIDREGIIYIGRSGLSTARTDRSLGGRILEFFDVKYYHSGSETYHQAHLEYRRNFIGHQLQFRIMNCEDSQIKLKEKRALREYFDRCGELPPYNSAFPGKWE